MIDTVSSKLLCCSPYIPSTEELLSQVNEIYYKFSESGDQGSMMMDTIMLDQILFMSNNFVTALKKILEEFAKNGFIMVQIENVVFSINHF